MKDAMWWWNCSFDFCNRKQMWRVPGFLVHFLHGEHWNPEGVNHKDVEPVLLLWTSSHGAASILLWSKGGNHRIKASLQIASLCFRKPYLRHDIEFLLFVVTGGGLSFILTCKTSFFKTRGEVGYSAEEVIILLCVFRQLILKNSGSFRLTDDKIQVDNSMWVGLYY